MTQSQSGAFFPGNDPAGSWDDFLWDRLLEGIGRQRVIPILGPALSTVEHEGSEISLDRFLAIKLAGQLGLAVSDDLRLGDIVAYYIHHRPISDLYSRINGILDSAAILPSRALTQIASITHFNLFVTTSFDLLLEEALNRGRFGGEPRTQSLGYTLDSVTDCEISTNLRLLDEPIVYHLFGKVSWMREYVVSDEDLLDYIETLFAPGRKPDKLFDALGENDLLLLGGNFSDWLVRLFLRLVKAKRLASPRQRAALEILADEGTRSDPALVSFLSNFSATTRVFHGNAPEFIEELATRWTTRFGQSAKRGSQTVFLSYAREDTVAARALAAGLEKEGFDVWFDASRIKGGTYDEMIERAIKQCALFIPLLSRTTEQHVKDVYFRREWNWAEERDTRNAAEITFILPIVVDESSREDFKYLPARFRNKHMYKASGGALTREITEAIRLALGVT